MSDINPNVVICMPNQLFTKPNEFAAAAGGKIYIGKIDKDPTVVANRIQVYVQNNDGTITSVNQPIVINMAGFPTYNGSVAKFVTVGEYSMSVLDSSNTKLFYFNNILEYIPDILRKDLIQPNGASLIGLNNYQTVSTALSDWPSFESYGGVAWTTANDGDTSIDNDQKLSDAIKDMQRKKIGRLYISKKYKFYKSIPLVSNIQYVGNGKSSSGFVIGHDEDAFSVSGVNIAYSAGIENLTIQKLNQNSYKGCAVNAINANQLTLTRLLIDGFDVGVKSGGNSYYSSYNDVRITNCNIGFHLSSGSRGMSLINTSA